MKLLELKMKLLKMKFKLLIAAVILLVGFLMILTGLAAGAFTKAFQADSPLVAVTPEQSNEASALALSWVDQLDDAGKIRDYLPKFTLTTSSDEGTFTNTFTLSSSNVDYIVDQLNQQNIAQNNQVYLSYGLLLAGKNLAYIPYKETLDKLQSKVTKQAQKEITIHVQDPYFKEIESTDGKVSFIFDGYLEYEKKIPYSVMEEVKTYNGIYHLNYEDTKQAEIQRVLLPGSKDEYYNRTITVTYPKFKDINYQKDYTALYKLIEPKGFRQKQDQLLFFRQVYAYDPMFSDPLLFDSFAMQLMKELGISQASTLSSLNISDYETSSGLATGKIPAQYYPFYQEAGQKYGIPWSVLASIHFQETRFGFDLSTSSAGAIGQMQFLPETWKEFEVDANHDGKADPYDAKDAIFTAANYLSHELKATGSLAKAIWRYNHDSAYVNQVLARAKLYATGGVVTGSTYTFTGNASAKAKAIIETAFRYNGQKKYIYGRGRTPDDVRNGIFDCSSFVAYVFYQNGVNIYDSYTPTYYGVATTSLIKLGVPVSEAQAQPGDLIFYDGHVGIYLGNEQWFGYQTSGAYETNVHTSYWGSSQKPLIGFRRILR
jgi:peptidoglycan DL-endopeptidase CwlO